MLDARRLRALQAVARTGSIAAAATELGYTASAVSQQLSALEREAGTELLVREARGMRLTAAGRLLADRATAILSQLAEAESSLEALRSGNGGPLRVAAFSSAATRFVPAAMAAFGTSHPDVSLSLIVAENDAAVAAIRDGEADLALVIDYNVARIAPTTGLDTVLLLEEPMHAALPATHPLRDVEALDVRALADSPWIRCATPGCAAFTSRVCELAGISPTIGMQTDDYPAMLALVEAGVGVAFVPELALVGKPEGVTVRPVVSPVLRRHISAVLPPVADRVPAVMAFCDALRVAAQAHA
ncbi:LysR family transcriptional regulator [Solirubrobacter soli]|uniref:LysR family transcriptional regulator n=1 Tax=Solirubrobacter soli TaxID=363832 RepID=UPI00041B7949|nr:LysR family transcriptional regulator [Solirubrobacter soli]